MGTMEIQKADKLHLFAQKIAEKIPGFFDTKGPGVGDMATRKFMELVRQIAKNSFGIDYSEKKLCKDLNFAVDFYFPDEGTAVEVALSLFQPISEYEHDIFKCLLAQEAGHPIKRLLFISKPGGKTRQSAPGQKAIADFVKSRFQLDIEIWDLVPPEMG